MEKLEEVFFKALRTAEEMSLQCLQLLRQGRFEDALNVLDNRERVINIVLHLDEQIRLTPETRVLVQENDQVTRLLTSISDKDALISELLNQEKVRTQNEIAKTRKNKENFKGYNLNNLK